MGILKAAVFLVLLAASIGFAVHNDEAVSLRYYFGLESISLPLFLWAFLFLFVGIILAGVAAFLTQIGLLARIRQLKKSVADLERKRNELKSRTAGL
jgi:uncharacterized integral membrane protein